MSRAGTRPLTARDLPGAHQRLGGLGPSFANLERMGRARVIDATEAGERAPRRKRVNACTLGLELARVLEVAAVDLAGLEYLAANQVERSIRTAQDVSGSFLLLHRKSSTSRT